MKFFGKDDKLKILLPSLLILSSFFIGITTVSAASKEVDFYVDSSYDAFGREELTATLVTTGKSAYFYVDSKYWNALSNSKRSLIQNSLEDLANEFDNVIYPKERAVFGSEWRPGIDNDEKITILISELVNDAAGYFNTYDGYAKEIQPTSNEREMIYLNTIVIFDGRAAAFLSHEFQHLITFYQKTILYGLEEDVWLNEARSEYATTLCEYNSIYSNSYLADRVDTFLDYPTDSLTEWRNNTSDYSSVSLFIHYLVDHYGKEIITKMVLNNKVGIESINAALDDLGYSETFSDIFADWVVTNYLNNCDVASGNEYCYLNKNLTYERLHTDYSASYSGFPNLIVTRSGAVKDWSPRWYRFRQAGSVQTDRDTLKLEFETGTEQSDFYLPYIITDQTNQTTVQFMSLQNQKATIYVPEFTSLNKSVILIPFNRYRISNFKFNEPLTSFTFTASSIEQIPLALNSVLPNSGSSKGGFKITLKGSNLSSVKRINFGSASISSFALIDDSTISFTAPSQTVGKIDINVIDENNNRAVLTKSFAYTGADISGEYPDGAMLRAKGDYKVYIINNGYKRWIQHYTIFNMYGHLRWEDIIDVEPEVLNQYQTAWLIRAANDKRVYEVNADGTKHWLNMTANEFSVSGRLWDMVYIVNNFERDFYSTGSDILFQ